MGYTHRMMPARVLTLIVVCLLASMAFADEPVEAPPPPVEVPPAPVEASAADSDAPNIGRIEPPSDERVLDGRHFYLVAVAAYGWPTRELGSLEPDPYGFGVGGRLGWTFSNGFYLGGSFTWYAGSDKETTYLGFPVRTDSNLWSAGIDVGYDLWIGPVITRYNLAIGLINRDRERFFGTQNISLGRSEARTLQLSPMIGVLVPIDALVVGVELYFSFIPNGQIPSAISLNLPLGVRF